MLTRLTRKSWRIPRDSDERGSHAQGDAATFIKYDVEGSEKQAIDGAKKTITAHRPKLSVALYHRNEDMFAIPLQIAELNRKYKFYMRHHPYIPDWDTNLYCI